MEENSKDKNKAKSDKVNHVNVDALILISLVIVLGILSTVYFLSKKSSQTSKSIPLTIQETPTTQTQTNITSPTTPSTVPTPVLSPTPSPKPIPHGSTDFFVSVGKEVQGPRMGKGTINPYDPEVGGTQRLTIAVSDKVPVTKVVAILKTDKKTSEPHLLLPGTGTSLSSNWTGEWTVDDTFLYTYVLSIQATSASGTSMVDVTLR